MKTTTIIFGSCLLLAMVCIVSANIYTETFEPTLDGWVDNDYAYDYDSNDLRISNSDSYQKYVFIEYDISVINDDATILGVSFEYVANGASFGGLSSINNMHIQPSISSPEEIWNAIYNVGINFVMCSMPGNYYDVVLGLNETVSSGFWAWDTSPAQCIQDNLPSDWFAMCFKRSHNHWATFRASEYQNPYPKLLIRWQFEIETPELVAPEDDSYIDEHQPTLEWTEVQGDNVFYWLRSGTNGVDWDIQLNQTGTSYQIPYYPYDAAIYWQVKAREDIPINPGTSAWSNIWSVHIENQSAIPAPILVYPNDGQNFGTIEDWIDWESVIVNNPTYIYHWSFNSVEWFNDITINTEANIPSIDWWDNVYWAVQVFEDRFRGRTSQWSEIRYFTIYPPELESLYLISPPDGTNYLEPTMARLECSQVDGYDIVYTFKINDTDYQTTNTYYDFYIGWYEIVNWKCKASEASGPLRETPWTDEWMISCNPDLLFPPIQISPYDGENFQVNGYYDLVIDEVAGSNVRYVFDVNGTETDTINTFITIPIDYFEWYRWRTRCYEASPPYRESIFSPTFIVSVIPDEPIMPELLLPENESNCSHYRVHLEWTNTSPMYEIRWTDNISQPNQNVWDRVFNYVILILEADTQYWWSVRSRRDLVLLDETMMQIFGNWTEQRTFMTEQVYFAPLQYSPANNSSVNGTNVTLRWEDTNVTWYLCHYSTDQANLSDSHHTTNAYAELNFTSLDYDNGSVVFWQVTESDWYWNIIRWSPIWQFTINYTIEEPPANELVITNMSIDVGYEWVNISFDLNSISNATLFIDSVYNSSLLIYHWFNVSGLTENTYYEFSIKCWNETNVTYLNGSFTTLSFIENVVIEVGYLWALIDFDTNLNTNATIIIDSIIWFNGSLTKNHQFNITGLTENTHYEFQIICWNESNISYYNGSFTTLEIIVDPPPIPPEDPPSGGGDGDSSPPYNPPDPPIEEPPVNETEPPEYNNTQNETTNNTEPPTGDVNNTLPDDKLPDVGDVGDVGGATVGNAGAIIFNWIGLVLIVAAICTTIVFSLWARTGKKKKPKTTTKKEA